MVTILVFNLYIREPLLMDRDFIAVRIAILTVSDTRTESDDVSGKTLKDRLLAAGHELADKKIVTDD